MQGIITNLIGGIYTVLDDESKEFVSCQARGKLRNMRLSKDSTFLKSNTARTKVETKTIKLSPKVGDHVIYEILGGTGYIMEIDERKNELMRPDIANVDQALLIFAAKEPEFSFILLDRFIALIERANVMPIIIITKIDLLNKDELLDLKEKMSYYEKYYQVYYVSSLKRFGVNDLEKIFTNKISVLTGQTGVGKSSLINSLIPDFNLETQEISTALGRGKHTTRSTSLYSYLGGMIADTPGFSSLDYGNMTLSEMSQCFIDFYELSFKCKFKGCMHIHDPGCHIKELYDDGQILKSRYENYIKFIDEIKNRKIKY